MSISVYIIGLCALLLLGCAKVRCKSSRLWGLLLYYREYCMLGGRFVAVARYLFK